LKLLAIRVASVVASSGEMNAVIVARHVLQLMQGRPVKRGILATDTVASAEALPPVGVVLAVMLNVGRAAAVMSPVVTVRTMVQVRASYSARPRRGMVTVALSLPTLQLLMTPGAVADATRLNAVVDGMGTAPFTSFTV
jgi:hypothetical protein